MIFTFDKIFTDIMNIFIAFLSFWPFLSSVASRHKQILCIFFVCLENKLETIKEANKNTDINKLYIYKLFNSCIYFGSFFM